MRRWWRWHCAALLGVHEYNVHAFLLGGMGWVIGAVVDCLLESEETLGFDALYVGGERVSALLLLLRLRVGFRVKYIISRRRPEHNVHHFTLPLPIHNRSQIYLKPLLRPLLFPTNFIIIFLYFIFPHEVAVAGFHPLNTMMVHESTGAASEILLIPDNLRLQFQIRVHSPGDLVVVQFHCWFEQAWELVYVFKFLSVYYMTFEALMGEHTLQCIDLIIDLRGLLAVTIDLFTIYFLLYLGEIITCTEKLHAFRAFSFQVFDRLGTFYNTCRLQAHVSLLSIL